MTLYNGTDSCNSPPVAYVNSSTDCSTLAGQAFEIWSAGAADNTCRNIDDTTLVNACATQKDMP